MVKAVKLADIAEKLNVSVVTVSKALSGQKGVSEELREKIKDLAVEMGYVPIHSNQKNKNKSYTIGGISLESYFARFASFYWKMYQELATRAVKKNCFTMLEVINTHAEQTLEPPKLLEEERVDGVIIIGRPRQEYLKMLYRYKKFPMVFMDFYDDNEEVIDSVISASFNGAYTMTNYLFGLGHTRIAYVGTLMYTESITDRYFGKGSSEMSLEDIYKEVFGLEHQETLNIMKDLAKKFNTSMKTFEGMEGEDAELLRTFSIIRMFSYDVYLKKTIIERIVDQMLHEEKDPSKKEK